MLECVVNVSEGRRPGVLAALRDAAADALLDLHADPDHNRAVLTLVGERAPRRVARVAAAAVDLTEHEGAHPRIGAIDVVPFVPLEGATMADAVRARDRFARWAAGTLGVGCYLYGPDRSLPEVRRAAAAGEPPDVAARVPHPTAGYCAVGARPVLVAYNLWLAGGGAAGDLAGDAAGDPAGDVTAARAIARSLRSAYVRALGLRVGGGVQVSCNLVAPASVGPAEIYDAVAARARIARAELVGLVPRAVLDVTDPSRWAELDLAVDRTIEHRLAARAPGPR